MYELPRSDTVIHYQYLFFFVLHGPVRFDMHVYPLCRELVVLMLFFTSIQDTPALVTEQICHPNWSFET